MGILCYLIQAFLLILFVRVIFSWVVAFTRLPDALAPVYKVVFDLTEPLLAPFRRMIPPMGGLDLSVFVLFIIGQLVLSQVC